MRHNIRVEGPAFRLRPVRNEDAAFILKLRSNSSLNKYLHHTSGLVDDQLRWLDEYFERLGDYYFVLEGRDSHQAEGVISVYDIDENAGGGEWGRWILRPNSLAAVECAWLIYRVSFEVIGLKYVYSRTVKKNVKVVSFHDSCGISKYAELPEFFEINGIKLDAVEHRVLLDDWLEISTHLEGLAKKVARKLP